MRIGFGYDVHPLVQERKLLLGGVEVPFEKGLAGHSDADVLSHAIIDAIFGAVALGDIGTHFPPSDPEYEGVSSIALLYRVGEMLKSHNWKVCNIDSTIVAQRPRVASFIDQMRQSISQALDITKEQIGIKATTTEGLGFIGRGEGFAAYATALVKSEGE